MSHIPLSFCEWSRGLKGLEDSFKVYASNRPKIGNNSLISTDWCQQIDDLESVIRHIGWHALKIDEFSCEREFNEASKLVVDVANQCLKSLRRNSHIIGKEQLILTISTMMRKL